MLDSQQNGIKFLGFWWFFAFLDVWTGAGWTRDSGLVQGLQGEPNLKFLAGDSTFDFCINKVGASDKGCIQKIAAFYTGYIEKGT